MVIEHIYTIFVGIVPTPHRVLVSSFGFGTISLDVIPAKNTVVELFLYAFHWNVGADMGVRRPDLYIFYLFDLQPLLGI
jgi:hypothetical protein